MGYPEAFAQLIDMNVTTAVNQVYTESLGAFWITILYAGVLTGIYMTTKSEGATATTGILIGGYLAYKDYLNLVDHWFFYLITAFMMAMLIFKAYYGRDEL